MEGMDGFKIASSTVEEASLFLAELYHDGVELNRLPELFVVRVDETSS